MGFDLYGKQPKVTGKPPELDWDTNPSDTEKDRHFEMLEKWEEKNPGYYFRNNVWWWRPLWSYICDKIAPNILTDNDKERGVYNDFHLISAIKASYIADKIDELDAIGQLEAFEKTYKKSQGALPDEKCEHCKGSGVRNDEYVKGKCNVCIDGLREHWGKNYPFEAENVRDFAKFARASGGFEIG